MERSFYDEHAVSEDWDWWHVARQRILARVLRRELARAGLDPGAARVLDVGCGTGGTTAFLARECLGGASPRLLACDVAPEALVHARRRGLERLALGSADALPLPDSSHDVVLALDVIEHHADDGRVAAELFRVVRPGGLLLATVPAFGILWGPHDVVSHHHRRYTAGGLRTLLAGAGFGVERATYFNALLFPGVLAVQVARKVLRGGAEPAAASDLPHSMPRAVNALVREVFASERHWLPRWGFPVGVSALAVATKR